MTIIKDGGRNVNRIFSQKQPQSLQDLLLSDLYKNVPASLRARFLCCSEKNGIAVVADLAVHAISSDQLLSCRGIAQNLAAMVRQQ